MRFNHACFAADDPFPPLVEQALETVQTLLHPHTHEGHTQQTERGANAAHVSRTHAYHRIDPCLPMLITAHLACRHIAHTHASPKRFCFPVLTTHIHPTTAAARKHAGKRKGSRYGTWSGCGTSRRCARRLSTWRAWASCTATSLPAIYCWGPRESPKVSSGCERCAAERASCAGCLSEGDCVGSSICSHCGDLDSGARVHVRERQSE